MIIDLSHGNRYLKNTEPLEIVGYLERKDYFIKRYFTKISIVFVTNGSGWLEQDGKRTELKAPFGMLNDIGEQKTYGPGETWDELYFVYPAGAEERLHDAWNKELFEKKIWPLQNKTEFMKYFNLILFLLNQPTLQGCYDQLDHLASCLLAESLFNPQFELLSSEDKKLIEIENWLTRNYKHDVDIKELAKNFGFSYPTFRRIWQKSFALSPYQYILNLRNTEACNLLEKSYLPIGDIAARVGFSNQHYFARFFKQINGLTPSEYRKRNSF